MEPAPQGSGRPPPGRNPHCFEVITANMVYYVGEDGGGPHNPVLALTGVGRDVGGAWEKAVRQAMMPVTPNAGVGTGAGKDHSESPETSKLSHSSQTPKKTCIGF